MESIIAAQKSGAGAKLLIAFSGILYGCMGYFGTNLIHAHLSVPVMLFWRFFIAALFIFLIGIYKGHNFFDRRNISIVSTILVSLLYGSAAAFYFMASEYVGTGPAMVVFFTYPAFVIFLSWIVHKNRISYLTFVSLLLILLGMILLTKTNQFAFDFTGMIFAITSASLYALYIFLSKKKIQKAKPLILTTHLCMGCAITFLFICFIDRSFQFPQDLVVLKDIVAISVLCTALPAFLMLKGLQAIDAGTAAILSVFEPIVTVVMGAFLLGELLSRSQVFGIFVILTGTVLIQLKKKERQPFV